MIVVQVKYNTKKHELQAFEQTVSITQCAVRICFSLSVTFEIIIVIVIT